MGFDTGPANGKRHPKGTPRRRLASGVWPPTGSGVHRNEIVPVLPGCYYGLQESALYFRSTNWEEVIDSMRTVYKGALPFDFDGLSIRKLTPASLQTASIATIDVPAGARHRTARSSRSDKLYVCLEGPITFVVQDREITLGELDVLHLDAK